MSSFLIVGAGAIGTGVAKSLTNAGHEATVVTRRGYGPEIDGVRHVAGDATDAQMLSSLAFGASAIFNCANPAYHRWPTDWPPIAAALLLASERSGATLVTTSNLYAYGVPQAMMSPHDALSANYEKAQVRATMWRDALAAHRSGHLHAVEVRASDFIGPNSNSLFGERVIPRLLKGRGVQVIGNPEMPHSWTYVDDVANTLVACALDATSWGRVWHAPTNLARSQREVIEDLCDVAGVGHVKVTKLPTVLLRAGGLFSPLLRELPKTLYQFEVPFVIDDTETREHFNIEPTPWTEVLEQTVSPFREHSSRNDRVVQLSR